MMSRRETVGNKRGGGRRGRELGRCLVTAGIKVPLLRISHEPSEDRIQRTTTTASRGGGHWWTLLLRLVIVYRTPKDLSCLTRHREVSKEITGHRLDETIWQMLHSLYQQPVINWISQNMASTTVTTGMWECLWCAAAVVLLVSKTQRTCECYSLHFISHSLIGTCDVVEFSPQKH